MTADSFFVFTTLRPLAVPLTTTSYVYAVGWNETEFGNTRADDWDILAGFEHYLPGMHRMVTWRHAPLAPAVPDLALSHGCLACRSSDGITMVLDPLTDGTRTHSSQLFGSSDGTPVTHLTLTRGTTTVFDADDYLGVVALKVPAARSTYTAVLDVDHYGVDPVLSTRTHTELGFSSSAGSGAAAPSSWQCPGTGNAPSMATAARTYAPGAALHDVVGGVNGFCGGDHLCHGVAGYDAPSGNGSPVGVGAL